MKKKNKQRKERIKKDRHLDPENTAKLRKHLGMTSQKEAEEQFRKTDQKMTE